MTTMPPQLREEFAKLLTELIYAPHNKELQMRAANLGIRIALQECDPKAADLVDSLMSRADSSTSPPVGLEDPHLMATMRATRKAIELSKSRNSPLPLPKMSGETADAKKLRALIGKRIQTGELQVAKSMALVGLSRHPTDRNLHEIHSTIRQKIDTRRLTAPIPFPSQR